MLFNHLIFAIYNDRHANKVVLYVSVFFVNFKSPCHRLIKIARRNHCDVGLYLTYYIGKHEIK